MSLTLRAASMYKHVQDSAADTWTIVHNMGNYPIVDVYVMNDGELVKIMPDSVTYIDPMSCSVGFSVPRTGFALVC